MSTLLMGKINHMLEKKNISLSGFEERKLREYGKELEKAKYSSDAQQREGAVSGSLDYLQKEIFKRNLHSDEVREVKEILDDIITR